ncbi:barstar family protein [Cellulomonas gilvus]|uniref:barstar family protein n=1 Tax=Cellulomonas gilvus TaxID=11 RepID=UPI00223938B4|nr:barstar family protein [Cellulomonas gilvus]
MLEIHGTAPIVLLRGNRESAAEAAWGWGEAGLTTRLVRGRKMRNVSTLFDEVSAALQFPYYFGENWGAFDECLADMDWLPLQVGVVIVVVDAVEVLSDDLAAQLATLVRVITRASETYAEPIDSGEWWDRPPLPFHVVLQVREDEEALLRRRWGASGAALSVLG